MTKLQFDRWQAFSKGLVAAYPATERRQKRLVEEMECFFASIEQTEWWKWMLSWDESKRPGNAPYACDLFEDHFSEFSCWSDKQPDREGKFHRQLSAAIRAGIDIVASKPGAGVIGFTVGDAKIAFGGELPDWFCKLYPGIEKAEDSAGVWL